MCRVSSVRKVYDDLEGRSVILGRGKIVMTFQKHVLVFCLMPINILVKYQRTVGSSFFFEN